MKYTLVVAVTQNDEDIEAVLRRLIQAVNEQISDGWRPQGGVSGYRIALPYPEDQYNDISAGNFWASGFAQAMVRD